MVHVLTCGLPPDARTKLVQALHEAQLLIPQGNYCIQDAIHVLRHGLQHSHGPRILDFVTLSHILAYNFQTVHILIDICYNIWKVQVKKN